MKRIIIEIPEYATTDEKLYELSAGLQEIGEVLEDIMYEIDEDSEAGELVDLSVDTIDSLIDSLDTAADLLEMEDEEYYDDEDDFEEDEDEEEYDDEDDFEDDEDGAAYGDDSIEDTYGQQDISLSRIVRKGKNGLQVVINIEKDK